MKFCRKWHNTCDELPKESGEYLCVTEFGIRRKMKYSERWKKFNCEDWYSGLAVWSCAVWVKKWAYIDGKE